jgi:hypothetical protein
MKGNPDVLHVALCEVSQRQELIVYELGSGLLRLAYCTSLDVQKELVC